MSWDTPDTDCNATILIPADADINVNDDVISVGDLIGVFYTDSGGNLACGGYTAWTGSVTSIAAWGSEAGLNNGFQVGEEYIWYIYDTETDTSIPATGIMSFGDNAYSCNGLSGIASIEAACSSDSGLSVSNLSAGTYSTTVIDSNGCETSVEFTISEPDALVASTIVIDATCNGGLGSVELTVSGGTEPYDMEDLSGLSAGTYSTTVIDSNGCETSVEFTISEPDALVASATVTDVTCNGGSDGSATLTVS